MRDLPDAELMGLYADGSEGAFNELFRRYEARIYGYFLRRVASESLARDLYQELFLRLHRFRRSYDPARAFEPWFFRLAASVLIDAWRQQHQRLEVALDEGVIGSGEPDAERIAAAREEVARVLECLSPEQARILVDAKLEGLEHAEIAARLRKSVEAVKQAASRALRRLRATPAPGH